MSKVAPLEATSKKLPPLDGAPPNPELEQHAAVVPTSSWGKPLDKGDGDGDNAPGTEEPVTKQQSLKVAFDKIDKDGSGHIDGEELAELIRKSGHKVTDEQVNQAIEKIDSDTDGTLNFKEFEQFMVQFKSGAGIAEIAEELVSQVHGIIQLAEEIKPIYERIEGECAGGKVTRRKQLQIKAGRIIDGPRAQMIILVLLVIDVICVLCELLILHTKCEACTATCGAVTSGQSGHSHRMLGGGRGVAPVQEIIQCLANGTAGGSNQIYGRLAQTCVPYFSDRQYDWMHNLHIVSVAILAIFALQLVMLMFVYGKRFFKDSAYLIDTVVVGTALVLENVSPEGGLFAVLLGWRVLRVVHGVATSIEINHEVAEKKLHKHAIHLSKKHYKLSAHLHDTVHEHHMSVNEKSQMILKRLEDGDPLDAAEMAEEFAKVAKVLHQIKIKAKQIHEDIEKDQHADEQEAIN